MLPRHAHWKRRKKKITSARSFGPAPFCIFISEIISRARPPTNGDRRAEDIPCDRSDRVVVTAATTRPASHGGGAQQPVARQNRSFEARASQQKKWWVM